VIILDSLLVGGIRFVLEKLAAAVDAELNDDTALREELLAAQMRVELGEMSQEEFAALEADLLARIREIRERRMGEGAGGEAGGTFTVEGVEATLGHDDAGSR
jgi:hypothetical protein